VSSTVATGGALLPVFLGSTIVDLALGSTAADLATVGMGAAIGHTVEKHRRQVSKDFLKAIGDSVQAGGAAVLVACDSVTGQILLADALADYPDIECVDLSAGEQQELIKHAHEGLIGSSQTPGTAGGLSR